MLVKPSTAKLNSLSIRQNQFVVCVDHVSSFCIVLCSEKGRAIDCVSLNRLCGSHLLLDFECGNKNPKIYWLNFATPLTFRGETAISIHAIHQFRYNVLMWRFRSSHTSHNRIPNIDASFVILLETSRGTAVSMLWDRLKTKVHLMLNHHIYLEIYWNDIIWILKA